MESNFINIFVLILLIILVCIVLFYFINIIIEESNKTFKKNESIESTTDASTIDIFSDTDYITEQETFLETEELEISEDTEPVKEHSVFYDENKVFKERRKEFENYVFSICEKYDKVNPYLVLAIIEHESGNIPYLHNGKCFGLMMIAKKYQLERMNKLGVSDLLDSKSNILVGVDILQELFEKYEDEKLVLMLYGMKRENAFKKYEEGYTPGFVKYMMNREIEIEEEYACQK